MTNSKFQIWVAAILVALNLLLFNLIFSFTNSFRADLTDGKVFSLSEVTERIIENLDEEVVVKAFISGEENLPEELRPTLPQVKDLLTEYEERSEGKVRVQFIVPEEDEDAEKSAQEKYGLQPRAFLFKGKSEQGVRSFYFALIVEYAGSRPEIIPFENLVDQGGVFDEARGVQLKNVEFTLTRAIKKSVFGFENQRGVFARFEGKAVVRTWVSKPDALPESFREFPKTVDKVFAELESESGGKFRFSPQPIPTEEEEQRLLMTRNGVRPIALPLSDQTFYLWAQLDINGRLTQPMPLLGGIERPLSEFELKSQFEEVIRRLSPGGLRTIGIVQKMPPRPNPMMGMPQNSPRPPFSALEMALAEEYDVRGLDAATLEVVPQGIDVLIVTGRDPLSETAVYAIDQYVMGGGKTIFLTDRHHTELQEGFLLTSSGRDSGLEDLLESWGVELSSEVALDGGNAGDFFWAVGKAGRRQRTVDFEWAALPELGTSPGAVNRDLTFTGGIELLKMRFPSAISTKKVEGITSTWVLRSSKECWLVDPATSLAPVVDDYPKTGYKVPDADRLAQRNFAVLLEGSFPSYWAARDIPSSQSTPEENPDADETKPEETKPQATAPLTESRAGTRILVIANDDFVDDIDAAISQNIGAPFAYFDLNQRFILDAIGWLLEDDDLVSIRNRGRSYRPLARLEDETKTSIQLWNFLGPVALLLLIGVATLVIRAGRKPLL